jgi:hypothetical protein
MNEERSSTLRKTAEWISHTVARAWPEETRHWGLALEAELFDIDNPGASLRWALGGVMLFTRAWRNHILHSWIRPAGVPEGGPLAELARNASRVPRTPRFVTALLLLASMAVMLVPDVRDAIQASFRAWRDKAPEAAASATFARLRQADNRNHDPQAMALIALTSDDREERIRLANEAVRLDPSLTWIYAEVPSEDASLSMLPPQTISSEWLGQLRKWDPDNAVPLLLAAHQTMVRLKEESQKNGYVYYDDQKTREYLVKDPTWLPLMDLAFQAPKYDSFYARRFDLYRVVILRYGFRDSEIVSNLLNRFPMFMQYEERIYTEILLDRGQEAEQAGKYREALQLYWQPARIGERMAEQSHTNFERWGWVEVQNKSLRKLQPLLAKMGQRDEAAQVAYRIEALQTSLLPSGPVKTWAWSENGWEGFTIRFLTGAILLLGVASLVSLAALFASRRKALESRGRLLVLASIAVDYCPLLLLFAFAGLFVAYRPIALMYEQYMNSPFPVYDFRELTHALRTPYEVPDGIWSLSYNYFNVVNYWLAAIVGLSILAVYIVFRGTLRRREIAS